MAEHVQITHEGLETRVQERTAALVALQSAEAALVESERAFRSTFDDAPLGIAQVSIDGRWIRVNRHLESILGWTADELAGTEPVRYLSAERVGARRGDGRQ